ncbi:hypothetical protein Thimo_2682 [Thioflavicoccus mobilis 8321]|uniref:DHD superfamily phosphohydrolase n=1 Tax=Thioflavicoccus mobilis 8321 TaxID=765912 RepID=L0H184_9GAMM|nr:hypothetical protein [Thioflavicoccus mobilis]AGA91395.1 hypothetical protein Thimo_2682 [Thioflavicoccus mobilis 8321]
MTHYDVFNGDADGLCALHQLRLVEAIDSVLVTGVKRDIALLERVQVETAGSVTVLDVSLDKNREPLLALLARDVPVAYFDHHYAGEIPAHPRLSAHIDPAPDRCTSLLVDVALEGRWRAWAAVGAFGDGMEAAARTAAAPLDLAEEDLVRLRELGICLNYNGYGERVADLHFPPDALYRRMQGFVDPLLFMAEDEAFSILSAGFADDMARAHRLRPEYEGEGHALYLLPAEAWARRISGVFANELAGGAPERAHALLTPRPEGGFVVSVRSPRATGEGADALCRQFPTGGGRKGAAGINVLAEDDYDLFVERFLAAF